MNSYFLYSEQPTLHYLLANLHIPRGNHWPQHESCTAIIQWGTVEQAIQRSATSYILNASTAVQKAADKPKMMDMLKLNGLDVPQKGSDRTMSTSRRFIIPVFQLQALAIFHHGINSFAVKPDVDVKSLLTEMKFNSRSGLHRGIMRVAVRAVYCLGLDFAIVHLEVEPKGRVVIYHVDPVPVLNKRLGALFAAAMNTYDLELTAELARKESVVMGMDPEFILREPEGKVISASRFLTKRGQVGCDPIRIRHDRVIYPLAELRPTPSSEPKQLFINLRHTMRLAAMQIADTRLEWIAGGMPNKGFALGGHIHLSRIWLNSRLLRALDNYMALTLIMIESKETRDRRKKYGFLGDFRRKSHGGFEYRTLPSWIVSPLITKGVLALTRLLAEHYRELHVMPLLEEQVQRGYYEGNKLILASHVTTMWAELEKMKHYETYRSYLDPLKKQVIGQVQWNDQEDFRKLWKVPPFHQ